MFERNPKSTTKSIKYFIQCFKGGTWCTMRYLVFTTTILFIEYHCSKGVKEKKKSEDMLSKLIKK